MESNKQINLLFRFGLGLIFLSNSVQAFVSPDEFIDTVSKLSLLPKIIDPSLFVKFIGINDFILFVLILSGKWPRLAALWAGLWVLGVIISQGVWAPETIFHIGVIALAVYYAKQSQGVGLFTKTQ